MDKTKQDSADAVYRAVVALNQAVEAANENGVFVFGGTMTRETAVGAEPVVCFVVECLSVVAEAK